MMVVRAWINPNGTVAQVSFPDLKDAGATKDLRTVLLSGNVGESPPPGDAATAQSALLAGPEAVAGRRSIARPGRSTKARRIPLPSAVPLYNAMQRYGPADGQPARGIDRWAKFQGSTRYFNGLAVPAVLALIFACAAAAIDPPAAFAQRAGGAGRGANALTAVTLADVKIERINERVAAVGSARAPPAGHADDARRRRHRQGAVRGRRARRGQCAAGAAQRRSRENRRRDRRRAAPGGGRHGRALRATQRGGR
ncbi:MAG: hypothetical protein WDN31_20875, partial [Hyphomicrobium sp.]